MVKEYRLAQIGEIVGGGTPSTNNDDYWGGDIPWIAPSDLTGYTDVYISHGANNITSSGLNKSGTRILPKNTVLFSSRAPIGYVAIAKNPVCTNQGFKSIICNDAFIDPQYLYYYIKANLNYFKQWGTGATFPEISGNSMKKIKIRIIDDISKQKLIASILYSYDNLIEVNNKRIKVLEQMAENLYKEWFVRFRFPGHETAEFENGIPKGWAIKRLGDYGRVETGKTPSMEVSEYYGNDYLFIKTPEMHGNVFVINTEEKLSKRGHSSQPKKLLPANSIMVTCIGTGGIVAINAEPGHTNQQINSIILDDLKYLEWLFFTCRSMRTTIEMFGATGSTMTNLSKGKFEKLKVIEPSTALIEEFHKITESMLKEIEKLMKANQKLACQRDLLLPRLMSGKLEV